MSITTVNPATGTTIATHQAHTDARLEQLLQRAHAATREWGIAPLPERARSCVVG